MNSFRIGAVVFDLDGTLIDSMEPLLDWLAQAIAEESATRPTRDDVRAALGPTERGVIARLVPAAAVDRCLARYHSLYASEHDRVRVYPGVAAMLGELRRRGISLGIFSGKSRSTIEITMRELGWASAFRAIVSGDDVSRHKPAPDGLLRAAEIMNVDPSAVLFVGDMDFDRDAARSAKVRFARAAWAGERNAPTGDEALLRSPKELIDLLDRAP